MSQQIFIQVNISYETGKTVEFCWIPYIDLLLKCFPLTFSVISSNRNVYFSRPTEYILNIKSCA